MHVITGNPNTALRDGLGLLLKSGIRNESRNGTVLQAWTPVVTVYHDPMERVMFSALRDANPFFHLYEALWMLAGRNDVASVARFAKQMEAFSDDGQSLWGAYGYRWRRFFGVDQLTEVVKMLRKDPSTRRAVMSMWAPSGDLVARTTQDFGHGAYPSVVQGAGKDVPCNTTIFFDCTKGALDMTVCNRSNDIVWGAYGANVVHMSVLHEFVAKAAGVPLGTYFQLSNNFHLYEERPDVQRLLGQYEPDDRYREAGVEPVSLFMDYHGHHWGDWLMDCEAVVEDPFTEATYAGRAPYFTDVVSPLMAAYRLHKGGDTDGAIGAAGLCRAGDWGTAAVEWLVRRRDAKKGGAA